MTLMFVNEFLFYNLIIKCSTKRMTFSYDPHKKADISVILHATFDA
jgi:hypothetical protein